MKIYAPNKQYTGVSAGVTFENGIGETSDPYLLSWFEQHGYEVEKETADETHADELAGKSVEELKAYAVEKGIDIGNASSANGITKKIREVQQKAGE